MKRGILSPSDDHGMDEAQLRREMQIGWQQFHQRARLVGIAPEDVKVRHQCVIQGPVLRNQG